MLNTEDTKSLIEKARASGNGLLLQQVIDYERARLREHGSKEGLDKFKSSSIRLLKTSADFFAYKKDCVTAFQHYHGGLECVNLLAHFNKEKYGIDPDTEILLRMTEKFDEAMATKTQINLGRRCDELLRQVDSPVGDYKKDQPGASKTLQKVLAIPKMSPVQVLNDDLEWDTESENILLEFGTGLEPDDDNFDKILVLSKITTEGQAEYKQVWHSASSVRPIPDLKKVKFSKEAKAAKVELASDSEGEDDAFADGYSLDYPAYVLYWAYRHLSKAARNVDSSLYHDFINRIGDERVKDIILGKSKSSALYVLHLLEGEFGKNAATQTIEMHMENNLISYKSGPADFSMRMRRARDYRQKIQPPVLLLLDTLAGLQVGGLAVRVDQERQNNQALFNTVMKKLPDAVQDPVLAMELFDMIDKDMKLTDGALQSSEALKGSKSNSTRTGGTVNQLKELRDACFTKLSGAQCTREKCRFGHSRAELEASRKNAEYMNKYKEWKKKRDEKRFYLKDFKGSTDADRHKAAISAAAGWRMEQKQKHFCPHPSTIKNAGPVLRTDLGHLIMRFDRGELSLSELLRLCPLWYFLDRRSNPK